MGELSLSHCSLQAVLAIRRNRSGSRRCPRCPWDGPIAHPLTPQQPNRARPIGLLGSKRGGRKISDASAIFEEFNFNCQTVTKKHVSDPGHAKLSVWLEFGCDTMKPNNIFCIFVRPN